MAAKPERRAIEVGSDDEESDEEVDCPLSGSEALAACKAFASATNTDSGLAMMMLQQNGWDLQRAIAAYQGLTGSQSKSTRQKPAANTGNTTLESEAQRQKSEVTADVSEKRTDQTTTKKRFKLLSWNIDGLYEQVNTIEARTRGVIAVIKREEPDAVFLQEVVPVTFDLIRTMLPEYDSHTGNTEGYFVVILTRRELFKVQNTEIIAYPTSAMARNLLIVHTMYKDTIEIDLMTSHLESGTAETAKQERMNQLNCCFQRMTDAPVNRIVLFGGDLNIREAELRRIGNIPSGICDLWIETGQRKECAYTWDMNRNDNLLFPSDHYRPQARFDRLYFRPSQNSTIQFKPVYFELEGLEKLPSIKRYCSDHWAIQTYFDL